VSSWKRNKVIIRISPLLTPIPSPKERGFYFPNTTIKKLPEINNKQKIVEKKH
jgi:hypothetical protein